MTDIEDVSRIAIDPDAFEAFYRVHLDAVHRFIARRVVDPHQALDLVSELFLAAVDAAHTYDPARGSPRAWLYGIGRNVIADEARRRGRERRATERLGRFRIVEDDVLAAAQDRLDAARDHRRVYAAMTGLPPDQRAILELAALDELSLVDCARVLGIRPVTARVRLHRARRAITALLAGESDGPGPSANPFSPSEVLQ